MQNIQTYMTDSNTDATWVSSLAVLKTQDSGIATTVAVFRNSIDCSNSTWI